MVNKTIKKRKKRKSKTIKKGEKTRWIVDEYGKREYIDIVKMIASVRVDNGIKLKDCKGMKSIICDEIKNEYKRRIVLMLKGSKKAKSMLKKKHNKSYKSIEKNMNRLSNDKIQKIYDDLLQI